MKANANKCHLLLSTNKQYTIKVGGTDIGNSQSEKLLGIKLDINLNFNFHLDEMCKRASQKLNALARISPYMNIKKRKTLFNAFFMSQFNYCPLVWMCHNRSYNNKINRLHERCLRIIYNDKKSSFQELLNKDCSVSIHNRNLQLLVTEMYKVMNEISPKIVNNIFKIKPIGYYNLRTVSQFTNPQIHTTHYGSESLGYLGPKLWEMIPTSIRELQSLHAFKRAIKKWVPESCPCHLCKNYIKNLGYILIKVLLLVSYFIFDCSFLL